MANDNPSANPGYQKAMRAYKKAADIIAHADSYLSRTETPDDSGDDIPTWKAGLLLAAAMKQLNAENKQMTTRLGVGRYQPYGRAFKRSGL